MKTIKNNNSIFTKNIDNIHNIHNIDNIDNHKSLNLEKSFSPRINKYLVSFTKKKPKKFLICNKNLLKINLGTKKKPKCFDYNNLKVKKFLLKNLKSSKHIDCNNIIPPKQIESNCWFNTFFVTFFISDKGRKFFKYFRQLMIEGKLSNGIKIDNNLSKAFFMLNIAIESATNHLLNNIAYNFNTNILIKEIYNSINKKDGFFYDTNIRKVGESGNPLDYYLGILNYLNVNEIFVFRLQLINSASNSFIENELINNYINIKPDIIILEIYDFKINNIIPSKKIIDKSKILNIFGVKYSLDSAIIRDINQQHFCSLLTCNKEEYSFDGASFHRMQPMKWTKLINSNKTWNFKGHNLNWSFRNGYQILFYYRI